MIIRRSRFLAAIISILFLSQLWCNGLESIKLPDGSTYAGDMKDGKPSGEGTMTFPDGSKYIGAFRDGVPNGLGTETKPDGTHQTGQWKNGKWDAKQTLLQGAYICIGAVLLILFRRKIAYLIAHHNAFLVRLITLGHVEPDPSQGQIRTAGILLALGGGAISISVVMLLIEFDVNLFNLFR